MKHTLTILALLAIAGFVCGTAAGQNVSLYDQEGTTADGYGTIDATGHGPTNADTTNWKYQYGGGTWKAIYGSSGWLHEVSTGDSKIDIECDIEMYYQETFEDNKIYFHLGDPYNASPEDKTAIVTGTFTANNGMYIGTSFENTSKVEADMLTDIDGLTGEIQDAMVGTVDVMGRQMYIDKNDPLQGYHSFNIKMSMRWDADPTWHRPVNFGTGASGTIVETLWWLVADGGAGTHTLQWKIELLPGPDQADGNYRFDPAIVVAPIL